MSWLQSLFLKQTFEKAKRDWRLLILDGHSFLLYSKLLELV